MALRPVPMVKVALLGLRADQERILTVLHDLRLAQVETLSPAALAELGPERGSELLRHVGDETLRFRALASALPATPVPQPRRFASVDEVLALARTVPIDDEVARLVREDDHLQTEAKAADDTARLLERIGFYGDRLDLLRAKSVLAFWAEAPPEAVEALSAGLPPGADATLLRGPAGETVVFLLVGRASAAEAIASAAQRSGIRLAVLPDLAGTVPEELARVRARRAEIDQRRAAIAERRRALAREWYPIVAPVLEALEVENRKAEVLNRLGASARTFALEAWVPKREVERLRTVLETELAGRVDLSVVPTAEEPPTMMANPRGVRRFEFFIRFYSLPQATEWDPTLVFAIVFPLFFGFMLGDWGYGLVILGISIWMIRGFPGARRLPRFGRNFVKMILSPKAMQQLAWALLPGCALAIGLGLFWDEFFGFNLFHLAFGYRPPIRPDVDVGKLLLAAGYIGLGMVVLGFLFGALKEYFHHHLRGAVGKVGGILFAVGIAFWGLALLHHAVDPSTNPVVYVWYACLGTGVALLLGGEGGNAILSLLEVVSHILSYTRLVGILLASVILALVINTIAIGQLRTGGPFAPLWILVGLVILVAGQGFNVILGVFEPGIQGARLIFVEYFSKFYSGNGRPFRPFGAPRIHTVPSVDTGSPPGPAR